ncbi:MAG: MBL fold metallo-hydrolase [bacterium]|nr:MBL fold metallo-hydrolase [bacterium]
MAEDNKMKITFLGTGANGGTPQVDCRCVNCLSKNPKDKRLRSSFLLEEKNKTILVECGPDARQQLLRQNLRLQDIDEITLTHLHHDHAGGLIELASGKAWNKQLVIPGAIQAKLKRGHVGYLFSNGFIKFTTSRLISFFKVEHWIGEPCFGIQIGDKGKVVYSGDISEISQSLLNRIKQTKLVIIDGTFLSESKKGHVSIKESCEVLKPLGKKVIFTHIDHSQNRREIEKFLKPFGFQLAFDGMEVTV